MTVPSIYKLEDLPSWNNSH